MPNYNIVAVDEYEQSGKIREPDSEFICPENHVLVGRWHEGDETGKTRYRYARLKLYDPFGGDTPDVTITVEGRHWSGDERESRSNFLAPNNRVITGRAHDKDENGDTRYETGVIQVRGQEGDTRRINVREGTDIKESDGIWYHCTALELMVGRRHQGDEHGRTWYTAASFVVELPQAQTKG